MKIIQDDLMKNIIEDYNSGLSPNKISKKYPELSPYQIRENLKRNGVFKSPYFTNEEINNIKSDYTLGISLKQLSKKYNRPEETIRKKLQSFGLYDTQEYDLYSEKEISILKQFYPIGDWESLLKLLPNREKPSICSKASKLGLVQENWNWTKEKITDIMLKNGYTLLSDFTNIKNKHSVIDADGYKYYTNLVGFAYEKYVPNRFSKDNIYTIDNIRQYIVINNIDCELISNVYVDNSTNLEWKCHCGEIFLCPWSRFQNGKHQCNNCSNIELNNKKTLSIDEVKKLIQDKPYKMIDETFTKLSDGFTAITDEGYYVLVNRDNVCGHKVPQVFHKNNPYTIQNIRKYIELNNIKSKLLSTSYNNNHEKLKWKCGCCGKDFDRNWNAFLGGAVECLDCSSVKRGINNRNSFEEVKKLIEDNGYHLGENIKNIAISSKKFSVYDDEGYFYETTWSHMKSFKEPERFHPSNKFTIFNINHYMDIHRSGEYRCISKKYNGNDKRMKFEHIACGCKFYATWTEMQGKLTSNRIDKYYKHCPNCNTYKTESNHASILKQVFLHEYPDTITEEKSCINPKTKRPLPTDIVNHKLKIAIEVQSEYHDTEERKIVDEFKKNYWLSRGYKFYDPDIRDYSILDMIQMFFPNIKEIPDYIDYNFSNCIDYTKVQEMLNEGFTILEISKILDIKKGTIQGFVNSKKVFLPDGYKNKVFNIRPIVRLSKDGAYIERFESLYDANNSGYSSGTIGRVLRGKQNFSYGSYWVYECDYLNNNYQLPEIEFDKFTLAVDKYDMNDVFICSYDSIYEAEEKSKSSKTEIYRVASGNRKSSRNEKWKFNKTA